MNWIDQKYISLMSSRLRNFKRKSNTFNFSCPLCNDSKDKKFKARGYIFEKKGTGLFHCHNCSVTMPVWKFIKTVDPVLHRQYNIEQLKETKPLEPNIYAERMKKPIFRSEGVLKGLKKISQLAVNDPVKELVMARKIPPETHSFLFKCDAFMAFTNEHLPGKFDKDALKHDDTRLILPFLDKNKVCFGYQGRAINPASSMRYITIILDEDKPKLFGLDRVDLSHPVPILEGPIDSLFVRNALATAGGDLITTLASIDCSKENFVICYDNEPRSKHTIDKMNKAIKHGYKLVIWPKDFAHKDVNDAIIAGLSRDQVNTIISQNVYSGLSAQMKMSSWSLT